LQQIELASPEQTVAMADEAMYCAKEGGRNRIQVAVDNTKGTTIQNDCFI